jgi:hypothetical protein
MQSVVPSGATFLASRPSPSLARIRLIFARMMALH